jgi:hypothetical protein
LFWSNNRPPVKLSCLSSALGHAASKTALR